MRTFWRWLFRVVLALVVVAAIGGFVFRKNRSPTIVPRYLLVLTPQTSLPSQASQPIHFALGLHKFLSVALVRNAIHRPRESK